MLAEAMAKKEIMMSNNNGASRAGQAQEFGPGNPKVAHGGFPPLEDSLSLRSVHLRGFPPPPNLVYTLSPVHKRRQEDFIGYKGTSGHCADSIAARSTRGDTTVPSGTSHRINTVDSLAIDPTDKDSAPKPRRSSKGEMLADLINFNREPWVAATPGVSGLLWSAKDQREDFITEIDSGTPLAYCSKCKKTHIPPGSPLTLQDRDTCYSYLPEWFPAQGINQIKKPWDQFTGMLNEIVTLQEISQGYNHKGNSDKKVWNLEFHEPHTKWTEVGRKSGWWRCRAGPDAPAVERNCILCHRLGAAIDVNARAARTKYKSAAARMDDIMDFMDKRMKTVAEKDKAIIEQRMRFDGWPQHLGVSNNNLPSHILPSIQNLDAPPRDPLRWAFSLGYLTDSELSAAAESANGLPVSNSFVL